MFVRTLERSFIILFAIELATLALVPFPQTGPVLFWTALALFSVLAFVSEKTALLVLLAELFYGAKGHMFELVFTGFDFSIRLAFFLALLSFWTFRSLRNRERLHVLRLEPSLRWIGGILFFVLLGIAVGLIGGNDPKNVFLDGNGYLLFFLALPLATYFRNPDFQKKLLAIFLSVMTFLAVKSLFLLAIFSHQYEVSSLVYRWVRDPRMFEVTALTHNFFRVFSQSHIFNVILFFGLLLVVPVLLSRKSRRLGFVLLVIQGTTIILSFSRSFWITTAVCLALVFAIFLKEKQSMLSLVRFSGLFLLITAFSFAAVSFSANYPYFWNRPGSVGTFAVLEQRSTTEGAAASSRFALLSPLTDAALRHPVLGSGLGATVTFRSSDPRVIFQTGGVRTTYAFEWGYLDLLLKFGLVGAAFWLLYFWNLGKRLVLHAEGTTDPLQRRIAYGLVAGLCVFLVTHGLSPYFNHPLGITALLLLSFFAWPRRA